MQYLIGKFSEKYGISIPTLRYYEREGVLFPARNASGQRVYTEADERWLAFIIRLKKTGMPIAQMRKYSELRYQGDSTIDARLKLLNKQRQRLFSQLDEIKKDIHFLDEKIETYHQMKNNTDSSN